MKKEFVRNPYNYDSDKLSDDTGLACPDESLTQQQFVEEADINYIANRFIKTGELPLVPQMPTAGDFEGIFDFQSAMNTITQAKREFMALPAKMRSRFNNDPAELIAFIEDTDNRDEAIRLGLIPKPDTIAPAVQPTKEQPHEARTDRSTQETPKSATRATGTPPNAGDPQASQKP